MNLARDGMACVKNTTVCIHWLKKAKSRGSHNSYVAKMALSCLLPITCAPIASEFAVTLPDDRPFVALGTDGYGRSDTRGNLRSYFGSMLAHIVVATLKKLADEGESMRVWSKMQSRHLS